MNARLGQRLFWWFGTLVLCCGCAPPQALPRSPELGPQGTVFRHRAPSARVVQVAGSWERNLDLRGLEWTSGTRVGRMEDPDGDGTWELQVVLEPGRYEYLFLIDGRLWEIDPANPDRVPDGQGGLVSLVIVP